MSAERLRGPAPIFIGHSFPARRVRRGIYEATRANSAVLLVGAPGTGKRTVAKILQHFGIGGSPSLGHEPAAGVAFISPLEQLCLDRQAMIRRDLGFSGMILGTRLNPDSPEGRARLCPQLLRRCLIRIDLPSLAERIDDIEALVLALLHRLPTTRPVGAISDDALECLRAYDWPGNISELEDVITKALAVGCTTQIELRDLPLALRDRTACPPEASPEHQFALALAERNAVERVMRLVRGNKRLAARLLKIGKTTLYRRLSEYDLRDDSEVSSS